LNSILVNIIIITALRLLIKEIPIVFERWDVALDCLDLSLCKRREGRSSVVAGFVRLLFLHSSHMMAGKNYMSYVYMFIYVYMYICIYICMLLGIILCEMREGRSSLVAGFLRLLFLHSSHMMAGR
jgi:hypothetical protein